MQADVDSLWPSISAMAAMWRVQSFASNLLSCDTNSPPIFLYGTGKLGDRARERVCQGRSQRRSVTPDI